MGFRRDWEPVDERPLLIEYACQCKCCREHQGFWRDQTERMTYEDAVEANPRQSGEGPANYIRRLSEYATQRYQRAGKPMPRGMSRRERDERLGKLREQARPDLPEWIEDRA